ncbi:TSUP family transporter [Candidatus Woesearchaeota archaeon]|nr:TSUP family transporter [Candidatus Woesearchaeota archaeon]
MEWLIIIAVAFFLQFSDAAVGFGFGEITALLLLLGFAPLQVVPTVILSSFLLSLIAGLLHHSFGNVDFSEKKNTRIVLILTGFGIAGVLIGSFVAQVLPETWLKVYVGAVIIVLGILVILNHSSGKFSYKKIIALASLAAFNKGVTGGGYGPVLANGQILSDVKPKAAVSMTALAESAVSIVGVGVFVLTLGSVIHWTVLSYLLIGGLIATPLATYAVKIISQKLLRRAVSLVTIVLGVFLLVSVIV